ncbi:phosphoglucosamine mutase [Spiractinospora alimapuensis]|uniref:phosphoglucosamine mutase n=1 Tax=Spiractinospora alimapuensis TaxID=2820884 RepID=UPI001EEC072D|nr:phosphoglucosamine mutase [Spiractinospora alimapuensis]QVQ51076.1 phosphoglucosamine mutase [Spiractinospora alimapuensis]
MGLFGTDGVRGVAGRDLTADLALRLANAAANELAGSERPGGRALAVVGRDPRASGEFLEAAVTAGLSSAGVDVIRVGVLPTPAVAYLTGVLEADLGVMISASHNPAPDNGIKFFTAGGHKLPDAVEEAIEARMELPPDYVRGGHVGRVSDSGDGADKYVAHLLHAVQQPLAGLRVVIDCAHGAASDVAPRALRQAGADVVVIGGTPDGLNINEDCGSTHLGLLQAAVTREGADVGLAFDGDADRCLAVTADGSVVDGDQIMAVLAVEMQESGQLTQDTLVVTVMSNLGLRLAMREVGIRVVDTPVGDRYVLEAMRQDGYALGGEQSGHVVLLEHATTGDGILTGMRLLAAMSRRGIPLGDLTKVMTRLPQVLINVRGVDKSRVDTDPGVARAIAQAESELGQTGRVLLRSSGTEPLVRVMVEAAAHEHAQSVAERLATVVRTELALD